MLDNDGDGACAIGMFTMILITVSAFHVYLWWLVFTELRIMSYRQVQIEAGSPQDLVSARSFQLQYLLKELAHLLKEIPRKKLL